MERLQSTFSNLPKPTMPDLSNLPKPTMPDLSNLPRPTMPAMPASLQNLPASLKEINLGDSANKFAKGLSTSVQATKERLGQVPAEDITELPQEYKDLESRVDALRNAHLTLLKITKVYNSETYDYPTQIQESITELSTTLGANITNFAATSLKNTNLPAPAPVTVPVPTNKTLPHALGRSSTLAANQLGQESKLGKGLAEYASAWEKVGAARVEHDATIKSGFLLPWQQTLNASIAVALKARQAVSSSRLELDAAKQALKTAGPSKQEQARLDVENAEDDLVQKTEVAINLMKTVLESPEPLKNLNELAKAQLLYFAAAAEALNTAQGELDDLIGA
jgi:hypothetical protein